MKKKNDVLISITIKVLDKKKGTDWTNVERRLEKECYSYLKVFLDPKINSALFDSVKK